MSKPIPTHDTPATTQFAEFMKEFLMESDRAAVVLGACKIDTLLAEALRKHLLPATGHADDLLEGDSPLSTFSARIKLCQRLALIDDQLAKLLNVFRRLRNEFAHQVESSSLSVGTAKDRVRALAQPFINHEHFKRLQAAAALQMQRNINDPGVLFRASLAVFYVHLAFVQAKACPRTLNKPLGVIENSERLFREAVTTKDASKRRRSSFAQK